MVVFLALQGLSRYRLYYFQSGGGANEFGDLILDRALKGDRCR